MKKIPEGKRKLGDVLRPTYSAVAEAQKTLANMLMLLKEDNRPLETDELGLYWDMLSAATLGLGSNRLFKVDIDGVTYHYSTVESAARWISSLQTKNVKIPGNNQKDPSPEIEIGILWDRLLTYMYKIFPRALEKAISISQEQIDRSSINDKYHPGFGTRYEGGA